MTGLVDRFGRTGFAALSSVIWALPMAAWAGSFDLSPIDRTSYPGTALTIGAVMFVVWLVIVAWVARVKVTPRPHRFALAQMSASEKRWTLVTFVFLCGLIAWLNAAATVDWSPLVGAITAGKIGPFVLAVALAVFLVVMVAGVVWGWRNEADAYRKRLASLSNAG
ncbi:MAG TPA: hypothetical protein VHO95_10005 [Candidatus Dormibacteraeota bacterium]|nr:hypothetical protein [Candidatus Dormibacteraeota bacterium]HEX2681361.1 hypothetical protein [Candidatus Dormibacteraeota bacterium]